MQIPVSNILEKYQSRLQWVKIEGVNIQRERGRERGGTVRQMAELNVAYNQRTITAATATASATD